MSALTDMIDVIDEGLKAAGEIATGVAHEVNGLAERQSVPVAEEQLSNEAHAAKAVDNPEKYPPRDEEMKAWVEDRRASEEIARNLRESSAGRQEVSPQQQQALMEDRMQDYLQCQKQQQMSM